MPYVSIGPVATLPGNQSLPELGTMCDEHPTVAALTSVQGETDSFGAEYMYLCRACLDNHVKSIADNPVEGYCDRCDSFFVGLVNRRDIEEGSYGRVYKLCKSCIDQDREDSKRDYPEYEEDYTDDEY